MSGPDTLKQRVRRFWNDSPCGMKDVQGRKEGSEEFFRTLERNRYGGDEFMPQLVQFQRYSSRAVLEVGCGLGTDFIQFARGGAKGFGMDLSERSLALTANRLRAEGLSGFLLQADAERIPFKDGTFDLVYSWGVLHHTPDTATAVRELIRVCKPGGEILVMLYHLRSLVAVQVWLRYGLLGGKPFSSPRRLIADHIESPGTKAFTKTEALSFFSGVSEIQARPVLTRYDMRVSRRGFLPRSLRRLVPADLGWFLVIRARK